MFIDELLMSVPDILNNYTKSLENPDYDVDPEYNDYNEKQLAEIEINKILVYVPDENGDLITKYLDKRVLSGEFKI